MMLFKHLYFLKLIVNQIPAYFKLNNQAYKEGLSNYQLMLKGK